jgi:F-type H+-transporting ATPase subunit b
VRDLTRWIPQRSGSCARVAVPPLLALPPLLLAAPAHASGGELVLIPELPIVAALVIVFVLLIFPVNALLFKPVFRVMDERAEKIGGARRRAERLEQEAAAILSEYEGAVRGAREQAEVDRRSLLDAARAEHASLTRSARAEAERELEHAREELARSLSDARATVRAGAEELAPLVAERVLGRSLS